MKRSPRQGATRGASIALAGMLVGLGVAVFAKAVYLVGFDRLTLEHILGPGMVAVGLLRLRLQRVLDASARRREGAEVDLVDGSHGTRGGSDGDPT